MKKCNKCDGCGQIANDDEGTPWKYWMETPLKSAGAMLLGLVVPLTCPNCKGAGEIPERNAKESDIGNDDERLIAYKRPTPRIMSPEEVEKDLKEYGQWCAKTRRTIITLTIIAIIILVIGLIVYKNKRVEHPPLPSPTHHSPISLREISFAAYNYAFCELVCRTAPLFIYKHNRSRVHLSAIVSSSFLHLPQANLSKKCRYALFRSVYFNEPTCRTALLLFFGDKL